MTAISWVDTNVIQCLYDLCVVYADTDNNLLDCSSYFGDKNVGTLYENANATDTEIKVKISVPVLIKTGETLTITEGLVSEDVSVASGVAITSQYPPYIALTVSALGNSYSPEAIVTWKQRAAIDTDFSWDAEYHFCDMQNYEISISLDREMTILQAIEEISKHADCFIFTNNWGVKKIHAFRPHYFSSLPTVAKNTNLVGNPTVCTKEMTNEISVLYGYNYSDSQYLYQYTFPRPEENNSYVRQGFVRNKTIGLAGVWTEDYAKSIATHKYHLWKNGLSLVQFSVTLQGILLAIGDHVIMDSDYPSIDTELEIIGIVGMQILNKYEIELLAYDAKYLWNNWFLVNHSGINTNQTLW